MTSVLDLSILEPLAAARRRPTYLRVVATTRCNLACSYCHMEGDPHQQGSAHELPGELLARCLAVAAAAGVEKFKFLGGEPLLRADLAEQVRALRALAPGADLSVITAGVLPTRLLDRVLEAGLDRVNVSIHGFGPAAFGARFRHAARGHALRAAFLERVLEHGRPLKLNYVYSGEADLDDLGALLDWAAPRRVLVNVLDNLALPLGWLAVAGALKALRGRPDHTALDADPHSLDTLRWSWADGLQAEIKHNQLGQVAPWSACASCPARQRCKEGIFALRLTHRGVLQPCMDRPELGIPLALLAADPARARVAWEQLVESI